MQELGRRTGTIVAAALVAAGAVIVAIGSTSLDPRVAVVLPSTGAGLVAAGTIALLLGSARTAGRLVLEGVGILVAGVVVAVTGVMVGQADVAAALPPIGGALVAAGTLALLAGAARLDPASRLSAH
jgi:hypothetical protein